ncbi:MAG: hypothetical protein NC225_10030 [Clostridium sp.]|nr:hypothetical protein [Clostridium sp.]MCM1399802.1 hypothetical protein [Clostridium sp.]MCM1459571.1 hypothetical protein [Bacteroides sp.]
MYKTKKNSKNIYIFIMAVMLAIASFAGMQSKAAEPKVMVTDYQLNPTAVVSGESFKLILTLKNTASKKVRNLKLTVSSEAGELLPAKGAGTEYISEFPAEQEMEITFDMMAVKGLEEKAYKLTIKSEYEDVNGYSYTVEDNIFIPISLKQRLSITDVLTDDSVKLGDDVEITGMVNNLGEGTLYNVSVRVEGENIDEQVSYIGNIESGKSGNIDIITKTTHSNEMASKNSMIITYEDKQGNKFEESQEISIYVDAIDYSNLTTLKETKKEGISKTTTITIVAVALLILIIILSVMRYRRKKKILEEF